MIAFLVAALVVSAVLVVGSAVPALSEGVRVMRARRTFNLNLAAVARELRAVSEEGVAERLRLEAQMRPVLRVVGWSKNPLAGPVLVWLVKGR